MVDKNDLALARANADFATANENSRAGAQAAILISGGAATAILAYLAKEAASPPTLLALAPIALFIYAVGSSWPHWGFGSRRVASLNGDITGRR